MAERSYAIPDQLEPDLVRARTYWEGLRRGESTIPFSDDVNLSALSDLESSALLIEVFENPTRFRINIAGDAAEKRYGAKLAGKFIDEIPSRAPLDALAEQCLASVEGKSPTYARISVPQGTRAGYARLVLPTWGNGHVDSLLCIFATLA